MTDKREELIEEAAKAMYSPTLWGTVDEHTRAHYRHLAASALAVFEQAHTPTDNEQAIIRKVREFATKERDSIRGQYGAGSPRYLAYADACDDILGILDDLSPYPDARRTMQGEPTDAQESEIAASALDRIAAEFAKTEGLGLTSDALWWWAWFGESLGDKASMLRAEAAALRAAAATQTGENRD